MIFIFSSIYPMDKSISESDQHEVDLIAIAARVHYEAEQIEIPVAIRIPHNGQASSIFSHMGAMERRLGQIEEDLKRLAIYEKYSKTRRDILYTIANNSTVGDEQSRTKDFLFMKAYIDKNK